VKAASIAFDRVTKRYGDVTAVDDVSFTVEAGTLVTLLGPSGCGKTTVLRMIAGLELPTSGAIRLGDRDVSRVPAAERDVSMVFQSYALFPHMSVLENVRYGLDVARVPRTRADERARAAMATVGLAGFDVRLPSELSGGQQQRVAVARALVLEPAVLLFDEPLSNLDARLRRQMREEIRELQQRLALTVVYVTHDQAEAMAVSDRIIVMNRGAIAQEGAPRSLYEQPRDPFVAGFMGDANRVRGELRRRDATRADVRLAGIALDLPHRGASDGPVDLSIRPEAIALVAPGDSPLVGTIRKAAYLGGLMEYTIDTPAGDLFAISMAVDTPLAAGARVGVALAGHGVVVIPGPVPSPPA
jgi:iron(III) transport system ATP-binding protein